MGNYSFDSISYDSVKLIENSDTTMSKLHSIIGKPYCVFLIKEYCYIVTFTTNIVAIVTMYLVYYGSHVFKSRNVYNFKPNAIN